MIGFFDLKRMDDDIDLNEMLVWRKAQHVSVKQRSVIKGSIMMEDLDKLILVVLLLLILFDG